MSAIEIVALFFEGMSAFVSPCILPMLPTYLFYLAGGDDQPSIKKRLINTLGFVLGFTIVFVLLGAGATAIGSFMRMHKLWLQRIGGIVLVIFGLHYMGVLKIGFLNQEKRANLNLKNGKFFSALIFGAAFSFGWTPCLGPLLGSAMMVASTQGHVLQGMLLLFVFSMGLGVPFIIVSLLYEKLRHVFTWIKKHYTLVTRITGILLILTGLALFFNVFGYYAALFQ